MDNILRSKFVEVCPKCECFMEEDTPKDPWYTLTTCEECGYEGSPELMER